MTGARRHGLAWLLAAACSAAAAADATWSWKATALAGAPVADGDGRSHRVTLEPSLRWKPADALELRGELRLRALEQQRRSRTDLDVRELTASWRRGDVTLKVGAQQVNWGRMDILRVTDIVNPVDQHDLFYEELPEAKLALWMANAEWQSGPNTLQAVFAPQPSVDRLPKRLDGLPIEVDRPSTSLRHSTVAVRYGFEAAGWNADLLAIHGWRSLPSLHPVFGEAGITLRGAPARQDSVGFSADKPLGITVLRLEGLYARAKPVLSADSTASRERTGTLGVGLDLRTGPWFVTGQVIAVRRQDLPRASDEARDRAFASVIVQRNWLRDRLSGRALHIHDTENGSSWTSLQATYELSANVLLRVQGDWFNGDASTAFGAFRGQSRIATTVRLHY